jgi:uncharacterized protein YggU (UPF0235/DUF167 family)
VKFKVKVIPNAKTEEIKEENGIIIVKVREKPEKGKATLKVLKLLSDYFKKPVRLVSANFQERK